MRVISIVILCVGFATSAFAGGTVLNDSDVQALHQSVCDAPIVKMKRGDSPAWACEKPRNYPRRPDLKDFSDSCALSFIDWRGTKTTLYYGQFSAHEKQAFAIYTSDCEPHSMNNGGAALFRATNAGFELLKYFPGDVYVDCAVAPAKNDRLQTIYCFSEHFGMGQLESSFGAITFADLELDFQPWASAGNMDAYGYGPMVLCDKSSRNIHHFLAVDIVPATGLPIVEAAMPSPLDEGKACERYRQRGKPKDDDSPQSYAEGTRRGLLRANEQRLYKTVISFQTYQSGHRTMHVEVTKDALPGR